MTFVDTNVLLDLLKADPHWAVWSERNLDRAVARGPLVATDVVFAELCVGSPAIEDVDEFLGSVGVSVTSCPKAGLFLAAKVYLEYRRRGGLRTGVLPDFFIGAHAAIVGAPLLTRDPRRYRTYFPSLELIAP
ncbi:MAG: type II toxin-antitoxin system VapC family toxin [Caulobacter sp.]